MYSHPRIPPDPGVELLHPPGVPSLAPPCRSRFSEQLTARHVATSDGGRGPRGGGLPRGKPAAGHASGRGDTGRVAVGVRHDCAGLDVIRNEAWPSYRTSSGVRLCWELEESNGPKGLVVVPLEAEKGTILNVRL